MDKKKLEELIAPVEVAHVTGQRFPKDLYYRMNSKLVARFTLCMPDNMLISVPIYEGESSKDKINSFIDNWYRVTKADPEKFDHFAIKERCPKCGGELRTKILEKGCAIWCINHPDCDYQTYGDSGKARELIFEKHGLKLKIVHKTGARAIFSNGPIPKKGDK